MDFLAEQARPDLIGLMLGLHEHLRGTLGAAVGLAHLDPANGRLRHVGVGNTRLRSFGTANRRLTSRDGTVGQRLRGPVEESLVLAPGDLVLLTTDGIREHFGPESYPGLYGDTAATVARAVVARFGRDHDDASCLALRYKP